MHNDLELFYINFVISWWIPAKVGCRGSSYYIRGLTWIHMREYGVKSHTFHTELIYFCRLVALEHLPRIRSLRPNCASQFLCAFSLSQYRAPPLFLFTVLSIARVQIMIYCGTWILCLCVCVYYIRGSVCVIFVYSCCAPPPHTWRGDTSTVCGTLYL